MKRAKGGKAKADRLFSLIVRARGECEACGYRCTCPTRPMAHTSDCRLQCAHIISRRYSATRCDERNAVALCASCHHTFTHDPDKWRAWTSERFGEALWWSIYEDANGSGKVDWSAVCDRLTDRARQVGVL